MIKLQVKCGDSSREMELSQPEVSIGRSADNVIALDDKKASRRHAVIRKDGDQYRVVDEMSGNGTKVNGKDINTHVLVLGDVIQIGFSTLTVTLLDAPSMAKMASAPAAAAGAAKAEGAPHAPPLTRHTRRDRYVQKSKSGQLVAFAAAAIVVGVVGYVLFQKADSVPLKPGGSRSEGGAREAAAAVLSFKSRAATETPTDALIAEGGALADKHPELEPLVEDLKRRRAEQIGKMTFGQVEGLVKAAISERRFGDALDALKALKGTPDGAQAAALADQVTEEIRKEFQAVDAQGRQLASEKKYGAAAEHYRAQAKHFRSTEHFRYLNQKPEALDELAKAETAAEAAKTARANAPKETAIAKVPDPAPAPKPEMPAPKPAMPKEPEKPAMPAMPAPKPAMPAPKPPEPPKPAPKPAEPEKPKEDAKPAEGPATRYKKPDVLCDCKKILKGTHCVKCERTLTDDDIRNGVCKKCEEKPKKIDLCVKRYFQAECHPEKISDKPVTCDGKIYDFPHEDKSRVVYLCNQCDEWGDLQGEIKHKADCKNRLATIKVCLKSGTGAHQPKDK